MDKLAETLIEELECEDVFTIPVFGGIKVSESVVVSWIIIAVLALLSFTLTRGFKVHKIGKRQAFTEVVVTKLNGLVGGMLGPNAKQYTPYMVTVMLFIGLSNIIGMFGLKSPTKDLRVTIALALMSIILVEYAAIKHRGVKGWVKSFAEPVAIVAPINILEVVTKPLSLCMRLFGNVIGAFVIMELIEFILPVGLPLIFSLYFDIFDGFLQAYVFVFLTSLYLSEATE